MSFSTRFFILFVTLHIFLIAIHCDALDDLIKIKEDSLRQVVDLIEEEYGNRCKIAHDCMCNYLACETLFKPDYEECSSNADIEGCKCKGMTMDYRHSVVRLPASEKNDYYFPSQPSHQYVKDSVCFTQHIDPLYIDVHEKNQDFEWQGFGSYNGMFRIYPGRYQSTCGKYDPRVRSWYISASTGPKDLVIVLDKSGSMYRNNRWNLARNSTINLLKTLTFNDYVSLVIFSTDAEPLVDEDNGMLRRADQNALETFEAALFDKDLEPGGMTNYYKAFENAFDILESSSSYSRSAECMKAIIFITDGKTTSGKTSEQVVEYVRQRNNAMNNDVSIFTYTIGDEADKITCKSISCQNNGIWTHINDFDDMSAKIANYYELYNLITANNNESTYSWVQPYIFSSTGELGTSVSTPVYDTIYQNWGGESKYRKIFIGVGASGLSLNKMDLLSDNYEGLLARLKERSKKCPEHSIDECEIESLRNLFFQRYGADSDSRCYEGCGNNGYVSVAPEPCNSATYNFDLWCNHDLVGKYDEEVCCKECRPKKPPPDYTGLVLGLTIPFGSLIIIIILVVIFILLYKFNSECRKKTKSALEMVKQAFADD